MQDDQLGHLIHNSRCGFTKVGMTTQYAMRTFRPQIIFSMKPKQKELKTMVETIGEGV